MNELKTKQTTARCLVACTAILFTTFSAMHLRGAQAQLQKTATLVPSTRRWVATSSTAMGITGDIRTSPGRLILAGHTIMLTGGRGLTGQELRDAAALFPVKVTPDTAAVLYRVHVPATMRFKNKNDLCGTQETTWMLVVENHAELDLAPFSGAAEPNLDPKAVKNSTVLCGTMSYTP